MRKVALISTFTLLAGFAAPCWSPAAVIYRSSEGWSVEGDQSSTVESSAADQMRKAEEFEKAGNEKAALNSYKVLTKQFGLSALAPKAQRKVGVLLDMLETELARHGQAWFGGARYSALDPYVFTLCRWTRNFSSLPARERELLGPYLQRVAARPAVQRVFAAEQLVPPFV